MRVSGESLCGRAERRHVTSHVHVLFHTPYTWQCAFPTDTHIHTPHAQGPGRTFVIDGTTRVCQCVCVSGPMIPICNQRNGRRESAVNSLGPELTRYRFTESTSDGTIAGVDSIFAFMVPCIRRAHFRLLCTKVYSALNASLTLYL